MLTRKKLGREEREHRTTGHDRETLTLLRKEAGTFMLTGEVGVLPSCFLEALGLLGVLGLPWPFFIFWPITDNQSIALGEKFSLPVCLDEACLLPTA